MKIRTIDARPKAERGEASTARIVMVELSGPIDQADSVIRRARELAQNTGANDIMKSFEWALTSGALVTNK